MATRHPLLEGRKSSRSNRTTALTESPLRRAFLAVYLLALAGCARPVDLEIPFTPRATQAPSPTDTLPTPEPPPKTLIVCLGQEPASLYRYSAEYLYGDTGRVAETVLQAIYDGPFDVRNYRYEPVILERLPDLAEGDARIETVSVAQGEPYFNADRLQPGNLTRGDRYLPAGCNSADCIRSYVSGSVSMDRMVVDFQLRPDIRWSDGEPLTAADSVFSFELDRHVDTPTPKTQVDRTASYVALDSATVRWTGIPGYVDAEYQSNFWSPLPQHLLEGLEPAELLTSGALPIGWGPYAVEEWRPGQDIRLRKNPNYFRAGEGLPDFEILLFRFLGDGSLGSIEQLLTSECDVLDETAIADALDVEQLDEPALSVLVDLAADGRIQLAAASGSEMERLEFGLAPARGTELPSLFSDSRTRAGIAACLDRGRYVTELLHGLSEVPETYLSPGHPLYIPASIGFDPVAGMELLEQAGWVDHDQDPGTARTARGVAGVADGTELVFSYLTTADGFHRSAAERIQADLATCGAELELEYRPAAELFEPWPAGPAFGRGFQTLGWAWPGWVSPLCEMFASWEIPSDENPFGANASGFSDRDYDRACGVLLHGRPDSQDYLAAAQTTQTIFTELLPAIPLYMRLRVIAYGADICGVEVNPTAFSPLWNLEQIRLCSAEPSP